MYDFPGSREMKVKNTWQFGGSIPTIKGGIPLGSQEGCLGSQKVCPNRKTYSRCKLQCTMQVEEQFSIVNKGSFISGFRS